MTIERRLLNIGLIFAAIVVVGSIGYVLIEGWSWIDAFYMSIITITTVGCGEVHLRLATMVHQIRFKMARFLFLPGKPFHGHILEQISWALATLSLQPGLILPETSQDPIYGGHTDALHLFQQLV